MARCKKEPRFSCYHCDHRTPRKDDLAKHIQSRHLPRNLSSNNCLRCGKNYSSRSSLRQHSKICGQASDDFKRFRCAMCEYRTYKKRCLADHILAKHLPRDAYTNRCGRCGKVQSSKSNLRVHLRVCGKLKEPRKTKRLKRFLCELCGAEYAKKSNLEDHKQSRHSGVSYECDACGKNFGNRSLLSEHRRNTCRKLGRLMRFECDECDYKTPRRDRLESHVQAKHSSEVFVCDRCGKKYDCQRNLYQHSKYSCRFARSDV